VIFDSVPGSGFSLFTLIFLTTLCLIDFGGKNHGLFSSPELKVEMSFSDRLSSVCKIYIFDFSRTNGANFR
jgi:hypothetical protein